eukprot:7251341-Prymnesium_polylepis.1
MAHGANWVGVCAQKPAGEMCPEAHASHAADQRLGGGWGRHGREVRGNSGVLVGRVTRKGGRCRATCVSRVSQAAIDRVPTSPYHGNR